MTSPHSGSAIALGDLARLTLLSALWGASFLFMRIVAPDLGPAWTTETRVLLAGVVLAVWQLMGQERSQRLEWRRDWRALLVVGTFNTALPFTLLAFAALTLPVGYLAILNATAPMWGALIGLVWRGAPVTRRKIGGAALGVVGVALVVQLGPVTPDTDVFIAAAASLAAALSYGWSANYLRLLRTAVPMSRMVAQTQLAAALAVVPALPFAPWRAMPDWVGWGGVVGLGLGCTALAYVLYFRLVQSIGATRTLTVTLLVPVFALLWGSLFLGETISLRMALGCAMVLGATWLFVSAPDDR